LRAVLIKLHAIRT